MAGAIITRDGEKTVKRKEGLKPIKNQSQGPEKGVRNDTDRALHLLGLPSAQTELALNSGGFLGMPTRS